jgi:hypothetical protein
MTPGLARSMKCGMTPFEPSLRVVIETGTQAAAFGSLSSMRPPAVSAQYVAFELFSFAFHGISVS